MTGCLCLLKTFFYRLAFILFVLNDLIVLSTVVLFKFSYLIMFLYQLVVFLLFYPLFCFFTCKTLCNLDLKGAIQIKLFIIIIIVIIIIFIIIIAIILIMFFPQSFVSCISMPSLFFLFFWFLVLGIVYGHKHLLDCLQSYDDHSVRTIWVEPSLGWNSAPAVHWLHLQTGVKEGV